MREFPQLNSGQYAVVMADSATGHVLTENGNVSISDTDEIYKIFSSIQDATDYISIKQKENDTWEFSLTDHNQALVQFFPAIQ